MWMYQAKPVRVIDGDTVDLTVDVGFRHFTTQRFRLLGVNTPERGKTDYDTARNFTVEWLFELSGEWPLQIESKKSDSFGRWLVTIYNKNFECLNEELISKGWVYLQ